MLRLLLPLLVLLPSLSLAQVIKGNVKNEKNEAIPFANVVLLQNQDKSILKGALTDEDGSFEILNLKNTDSVYLQIKSIGYQVFTSNAFLLNENLKPFNLVLKEDLKQLDEVVVQAQGRVLEQSLGTLSYNLAEAKKIHAVNSTWEMLGRIPGVSTDDMENSIKVNGKNSIQFEIDGRIQRVDANQISSVLKSLAIDDIEEIKVHTSPSSKYESNTEVVIEIKTKRKKENGWTGTENLSISHSIFPKLNNGLYLDGRFGDFYLKGLLTTVVKKGYQLEQRERLYDSETQESSKNKWFYGGHYFLPSIDLGWDISKKDFIGFAYQTRPLKWRDESYTNDFFHKRGEEDSLLHSVRDQTSTYSKHIFNINYKRKFEAIKGELSLGGDLILVDNKENQMVSSYSKNLKTESNALLLDQLDSKIQTKTNVQTYYLDYEMPISNLIDDFKIGLKYSKQSVLNEPEYLFKNNPSRNENTSFDYQENVFASYANVSKKIGKFALATGVRIERYERSANIKSVDSLFINYLPNFSLSYNPNDDHSFSWSWTEKIHRPGHSILNPFRAYGSISRYAVGNPTLLPLYINNTEFNYVYKSAYSLSVYRRKRKNIFQQISILDEESGNLGRWEWTNTTQNIYTGISLNVPVNWKKGFFKSTFDFNLYRTEQDNDYLGRPVIVDNTAWELSVQNNMKLPAKINFEFSFLLESPWKSYTYEFDRYLFTMNMNIKRSFLSDKASIILSVRDLFNAYNYEYSSTIDEHQKIYYNNIRENRVLSLKFTYRFGKDKLKVQNKMNKGNLEERNRL